MVCGGEANSRQVAERRLLLAEKTHHHNLDFRLTRRAFLPALVREVRVLSSTLKGDRNLALSELGNLPDEQLAVLRPMILPAFSIYVDGERVVGRHKETGVVIDLFPAEKEGVLTLNQFNGKVTLGAAGGRLAQHMGWDEAQGFAYVKDLFLSLVGHLVCIPQNYVESEE
jgi:hypothetical protein